MVVAAAATVVVATAATVVVATAREAAVTMAVTVVTESQPSAWPR